LDAIIVAFFVIIRSTVQCKHVVMVIWTSIYRFLKEGSGVDAAAVW